MLPFCFVGRKQSNREMAQIAIIVLMLLLVMRTAKMASVNQLSSTYYDETCPDALSTIREAITSAVSSEQRMAASLIRLHFHDCFVQGCDASILLDNSVSDFIVSEKIAPANRGTLRGYEVIENAKFEVEKICPGFVSCADILAVAARDASSALGGPSWTVKLGRRDSTTTSITQAITQLPSFTATLDSLISTFASKGLSARDLVALSGAHTIGQAQCFTFQGRINNGTNIDADFAATLRSSCPSSGGSLAALDLVTPFAFDNNYYKNLVEKKGLLETDQVLFSGGSTDEIVTEYSSSSEAFMSDFASAMVRMGDIEPLTGSHGEIRKICSAVN